MDKHYNLLQTERKKDMDKQKNENMVLLDVKNSIYVTDCIEASEDISEMVIQHGQDINNLSVVYLKKSQKIIINGKHVLAKYYEQTVPLYMSLSQESRDIAKENAPEEILGTYVFLDKIIEEIKVSEMLKSIRKEVADFCFDLVSASNNIGNLREHIDDEQLKVMDVCSKAVVECVSLFMQKIQPENYAGDKMAV